MDDEAVIRDVLAGDRERFRVLVRRFQGPVFAVIRSFVGDGPQTEDLAQETFLAAFRSLDRFRSDRGRFSSWLYVIARNKCRDALRRRAPVSLPRIEQASVATGDDSEIHTRLDEALARLPPQRRVAFLLAEVHGLAHAEIAEIEDVAIGTIKSRVHRAREELRALLKPQMERDQ